MGHATNKDTVLRELTRKTGEVVYRADIAKDTGLTENQVSSAVWALLNQSGDISQQIETVVRGRSWRYWPNGQPNQRNTPKGRRVFEEVGPAKIGVILECEDGTLWKAEQL